MYVVEDIEVREVTSIRFDIKLWSRNGNIWVVISYLQMRRNRFVNEHTIGETYRRFKKNLSLMNESNNKFRRPREVYISFIFQNTIILFFLVLVFLIVIPKPSWIPILKDGILGCDSLPHTDEKEIKILPSNFVQLWLVM